MKIKAPTREHLLSLGYKQVDMTLDSYETVGSYTVLSEEPYLSDVSGECVNSLYKNKTFIQLPCYMPNYILTNKGIKIFKTLWKYGFDQQDTSKFEAIYTQGYMEVKEDGSLELHENITNDIFYRKGITYIGGDILKYIIDNVDLDEACCNYFKTHLQSKIPKELELIVKNKSSDVTPHHLYKDFYSSYPIDKFYVEELFVGEKGKYKPTNNLIMLLEYRKYPEKLQNLVIDVLPLLALGFRQDFEGRRHPITDLYDTILTHSKTLSTLLTASNTYINQVVQHFKLFDDNFNRLFNNKGLDDEKYNLLGYLIGKTGMIRGQLQSTIVDYSGRAVISVNPDLPIDTVGINKHMYVSLLKHRLLELENYSIVELYNMSDDEKIELLQSLNIDFYSLLGRQPTLYRHGAQGFKIVPSNTNGIQINPLITPAFNADFDGDQMWMVAPITDEAREDISQKMYCMNNLYLDKDGTSQYSMRQEMLLGLYLLKNETRNTEGRQISCAVEEMFDKVLNGEIELNDTVDGKTVAEHLLRYGGGYGSRIPSISAPTLFNPTEGYFKTLVYEMDITLGFTKTEIREVLEYYLKLAYLPFNSEAVDLSVLTTDVNSKVKKLLEKFNVEMYEKSKYVNYGMQSDAEYNMLYVSEYNKLKDEVLKLLRNDEHIKDSGYLKLIESKARGSNSNLLQLFGMKGLIMKDSHSSFNTIIKESLENGMTCYEHFITAYGGRQGIIDKSINTHKPGYLNRIISHSIRHYEIVTEDCGTDKGIVITQELLERFASGVKFNEFVSKLMKGRYIVGRDEPIITDTDVHNICMDIIQNHKVVSLRSPVYCNNPVCAKCYGHDLLTHREIKLGSRVGFAAEQSIGEPMTQLIMKNFQQGGVASDGNLTSSFSLVESYVSNRFDRCIDYNKCNWYSPYDGKVSYEVLDNGTIEISVDNKVLTKANYSTSLTLKDSVKKGDLICKARQSRDINNVIAVKGIDAGIEELIFQIYTLYASQIFVNVKHFEVLVLGMIKYVPFNTTHPELKDGNAYSSYELLIRGIDSFVKEEVQEELGLKKILVGVKAGVKMSNDLMTCIGFEDLAQSLSNFYNRNDDDKLMDNMTRVSFGLRPQPLYEMLSN